MTFPPCMSQLVMTLLALALSNFSLADSSFLSHESQLSPAGDPSALFYLPAASKQQLAKYTKIMVDEPEVFIADDSPYKGMKPARLNAIASAFRDKVIAALSSDYKVVDQPGSDVLFLRLALADLAIKKKRFHVLGYTPVGLVYRAGRDAFETDFDRAVQHYSLVSLKIEGQLRNSQSAAILGEFVNTRADDRADPQSWKAMLSEMDHYSTMLNCMIVNARNGLKDEGGCVQAHKQLQSAIELRPFLAARQ